jgi:hypothetical protein
MPLWMARIAAKLHGRCLRTAMPGQTGGGAAPFAPASRRTIERAPRRVAALQDALRRSETRRGALNRNEAL